jgi:hypothetical protein
VPHFSVLFKLAFGWPDSAVLQLLDYTVRDREVPVSCLQTRKAEKSTSDSVGVRIHSFYSRSIIRLEVGLRGAVVAQLWDRITLTAQDAHLALPYPFLLHLLLTNISSSFPI